MSMRGGDDTISVILGGGRGSRLFPLTKLRAKPAVPLAGKYRIIDVPISNCLNSGCNRIYVLTQFQSASLHEHVQSTYRFDRFGGGFVELLAAQQTMESNDWYQGTADAVRQNLAHFSVKWKRMLILSGDQLYRMDYSRFIENHETSQADMSIAVLPVSAEAASALGILKVDETGRVIAFHEKPAPEELAGLETDPSLFEKFGIKAEGRPYLASMGIYVFNREPLYDELTKNRFVDFGKNLFPSCIRKYNVQAYLFDGYWEDIGTVKSFHEANLMLAKSPETFRFADDHGLIYTRARTLPATILGNAQVIDSLIAEGCNIRSGVIEQSVIGIRAKIGANAQIRRSIVMGSDQYESAEERHENARLGRPNIGIGNGCVIENAIVDKNARIGDDVVIRPPEGGADVDTPIYAVRDGLICIQKDAVVRAGTRIGV